jgi:D-tyrosyl-tRNA(Tyr) deacylase
MIYSFLLGRGFSSPLDSEKSAQRLFERIVNYRIFPDVENRMNLSLNNIQGGLLLIPQFTLAADTNLDS